MTDTNGRTGLGGWARMFTLGDINTERKKNAWIGRHGIREYVWKSGQK